MYTKQEIFSLNYFCKQHFQMYIENASTKSSSNFRETFVQHATKEDYSGDLHSFTIMHTRSSISQLHAA